MSLFVFRYYLKPHLSNFEKQGTEQILRRYGFSLALGIAMMIFLCILWCLILISLCDSNANSL